MAVVVEAVYGRRKGESRAVGTGRYKGESRAGGTGRYKGEKVKIVFYWTNSNISRLALPYLERRNVNHTG